MPNYDFECQHCKEVLEKNVKYENRDNPKMKCVTCGGDQMKRIMSAPMLMEAAYPDGTKRFEGLRESRRLEKVIAEAKATGDRDTEKKAKAEKKKT